MPRPDITQVWIEDTRIRTHLVFGNANSPYIILISFEYTLCLKKRPNFETA